MNAKYGKLYSSSKIKAGSYPGYDKDNSITDVWNLIVTGDKMSNEDAYAIVKTLVGEEGRHRRRAQGSREFFAR